MRILLLLLTLGALAYSSIGNVGVLKGSATVTRSSATLDITNGMALEVSDKITTESKSRLQIILKDDTVVTIGPNSTFVFDAYNYGGKENSVVKMRIDRGFFRSVTGKIGKIAPERFKVKTSSATIGIRGTDFSALVAEQKEVITCYKGGIDVSIGMTDIAVDAGMMLDVAGGKAVLKRFDHGKLQSKGKSKGSTKKRRAQSLDQESDDSTQISADELADVTQQEVLSTNVEHLEDPTVGFEGR